MGFSLLPSCVSRILVWESHAWESGLHMFQSWTRIHTPTATCPTQGRQDTKSDLPSHVCQGSQLPCGYYWFCVSLTSVAPVSSLSTMTLAQERRGTSWRPGPRPAQLLPSNSLQSAGMVPGSPLTPRGGALLLLTTLHRSWAAGAPSGLHNLAQGRRLVPGAAPGGPLIPGLREAQ